MTRDPPNEREDRGGQDDALSEIQHRILDLLRDFPGASIQTAADQLNLSHSTVRYHAKLLEERGDLKRRRDGRKVRLFLDGAGLVTRIAPILRDPARERILEYLADQPVPYLTINRIATDLDLQFGLVKRTLEQLVDLDVLEMERVMGRYRIEERLDIQRLLERAR